MVFKKIKRFGGHEQVVFFQDPSVGLKGIIAVHSTHLGPALGGLRLWNYRSEEDALDDVLKLSRGMTYKAACAGLELGGGKSVIIGDPKNKSPALFRSYGRFVDSLNGRYITAEDVGTSVDDMKYIREETPFVTGLARSQNSSGDPSPFTARSALIGMKAAVQHKLNKSSLSGLKIAVQGMGHVGWYLAEYLLAEGCRLVICDISAEKAQAFKNKHPQVELVSAEHIYDVKCDIFSPCALGAVINQHTLKRFKCLIIAGAANNQLESLETEIELKKRGILYAPDFVINAGGLINVFVETTGSYSKARALKKIDGIYDVLTNILQQSDQNNTLPTDVAIAVANKRIYSQAPFYKDSDKNLIDIRKRESG